MLAWIPAQRALIDGTNSGYAVVRVGAVIIGEAVGVVEAVGRVEAVESAEAAELTDAGVVGESEERQKK